MFPACAPLSNPWMSVLDPGRAERELGFGAGSFDDWLPQVVKRVSEAPASRGFDDIRALEIDLAG